MWALGYAGKNANVVSFPVGVELSSRVKTHTRWTLLWSDHEKDVIGDSKEKTDSGEASYLFGVKREREGGDLKL